MKGRLEEHVLHARALEGNPLGDPLERTLIVYRPEAQGPLPVIYFLHGFAGNVRGWVNSAIFTLSVPERLDALIASGAIPPVLGVFIDGWTALGGSQWDNAPAIGRYRDYVVQDVVGFIDRTYATVPRPSGRAIFGKSSGGYGALNLARHHPDVFGHMACHAGDSYFEYCYLPDFPKAATSFLKAGGEEAWFRDFVARARATRMKSEDFPTLNTLAMAAAYSPDPSRPLGLVLPFELDTARVRPELWERWLAHDPVRWLEQDAPRFRRLESVFIDCGTRDEANLRWGTRMVVDRLRQASVTVQHEEFEDGHSGTNYRYERSLTHVVPRMGRS
jgi:pimeloyl-ACP methyl ester carboxylesterase